MILPISSESHAVAAAIVKTGGIVAFRTDTFYGLGVDQFDGAALRKLRARKSRAAAKPVLVVLSDDCCRRAVQDGPQKLFAALIAACNRRAVLGYCCATVRLRVKLQSPPGAILMLPTVLRAMTTLLAYQSGSMGISRLIKSCACP
jgi:hypothetical protein